MATCLESTQRPPCSPIYCTELSIEYYFCFRAENVNEIFLPGFKIISIIHSINKMQIFCIIFKIQIKVEGEEIKLIGNSIRAAVSSHFLAIVNIITVDTLVLNSSKSCLSLWLFS